MAYSSGFNPHPRISYAGAAPTGAASKAEYLELALAEVVDPATVHAALDEAMPAGLDVVEVVESPGGSLADLLEASEWTIEVQVPLRAARQAVRAFLGADQVPVQRMTKKGLREFDSRAAVLRLEALPDTADSETGSELNLVLRHLEPAVRPDDVLSGLASVGGLEVTAVPLLTREAQGPLDEVTGEIGDPLHPR
jgi:radical SAM-linked protein